MNEEDRRLEGLLRQWQCRVERDPALGAAVWQKIAEREESPGFGRGLQLLWSGRPLAGAAIAAGLLLAALLGGITAAELRVQSARQFSSVQNQEEAYFESINPIALARHGHP